MESEKTDCSILPMLCNTVNNFFIVWFGVKKAEHTGHILPYGTRFGVPRHFQVFVYGVSLKYLVRNSSPAMYCVVICGSSEL